MGNDPAALVARLSKRERDCLRLVGQLKRTKTIAAELGVSESTVGNHCAAAVRKLEVTDRMAAARLVIDADARASAPMTATPIISLEPQESFSRVGGSSPRRFLDRVARLPWPVPTEERPTNDLTTVELAFATAAALAALLLCAAAYLLAVAALATIH